MNGMYAPAAPKGLRGGLIRLLAGWTFNSVHERMPGWCTCVFWLRSDDVSDLGVSLIECCYGEWATPGLNGFLPPKAFRELQEVSRAA